MIDRLARLRRDPLFRSAVTMVPGALFILIFLLMILIVSVVGALGLFGTLSMNVLERRREIGVMRTVGASTGTILWTFLLEGLLLGLLGWNPA